ncbi:MAG: hypothetical protein IJS50_05800 [Desulfovibrio sp.]|nr:hypothetical protein [Desulfovibrio sp.]
MKRCLLTTEATAKDVDATTLLLYWEEGSDKNPRSSLPIYLQEHLLEIREEHARWA